MNAGLTAKLAAAKGHFRNGNLMEAKQSYLQIQELDPQNSEVLTRLGEIALWKNQTEAAEHYFKSALEHGSWLAKKWPFNIPLHTALAMTYYRQDRFGEAAECFHRAAGRVVLPPFRDLQALGSHLALFNGQTPYGVEGVESTQIPFTVTDPLPVVQVSVNGSEPLPFFIDTGGAEVIVDRELAQKVGAVQAGSLRGEGGGTQGATGLGKVDSMVIGDMTIRNVPIHIMDTHHFAAVFDGLAVKGVIGTRLLMHFLATIDYRDGYFRLQPKSAGAMVETHSATVIPFWLIQTHYMVAQGSINGKTPMLMFVDTGLAGKGFSAEESVLREAGIGLDWSKEEKGAAAFGETTVLDITAEQVTLGNGQNQVLARHVPGVAFQKPFGILGHRLGFWIGGVVSHQFFRPYCLTLDFVDMRLILSG
jgi:predicted aspartyl protease